METLSQSKAIKNWLSSRKKSSVDSMKGQNVQVKGSKASLGPDNQLRNYPRVTFIIKFGKHSLEVELTKTD